MGLGYGIGLWIALWMGWTEPVFHPFHVSVCEVTYNTSATSLEIVQRIQIDDLEQGLQYHHNWPWLDMLDPAHTDTLDALIEPYYRRHFSLGINNTKHPWDYLGHEIKDDQLIIYAEASVAQAPPCVQIISDLLTERIAQQINLVHIQTQLKWRSFRLSKYNTSTECVKM